MRKGISKLTIVEIIFWSLFFLVLIFYCSYYLLNIYFSRKPGKYRKKEIFPVVSFLVPTYNEDKTILQKLENITSLDYPKTALEILVVDSNSSDNTQRIVREFISQNLEFNIHFMSQEKKLGKASALNLALQHAHGEIVIMSDADALFDKSAITKLVENFADPIVGAVTGKVVIANANQNSSTKLERNYRGIFDILRMGESNIDSTPVFSGPVMAFRKDLFESLSTETIADDTEISMMIREKGAKTVFAQDAIAYECTPVTFNSKFKQKVRRGQGLVQSFWRHKNFLFNPKHGRYGWVVFPAEFFMHLISPILLVAILLLTFAVILTNPFMITYFALAAVSLLAIAGLTLLAQRNLGKNKNAPVNPFLALRTFLDHELCLLGSITYFLMGKRNFNWEQIEEVRTQSAHTNSQGKVYSCAENS